MEKITQTKEMYEVSLRSIGAWNREIIERMKSLNLDVSKESIVSKDILKYAQDIALMEQDKSTNESAAKAEVFLQWLAKKNA